MVLRRMMMRMMRMNDDVWYIQHSTVMYCTVGLLILGIVIHLGLVIFINVLVTLRLGFCSGLPPLGWDVSWVL